MPFDIRLQGPRSQVPADEIRPVVIVSADSHAALPAIEYRDYLERKYWPSFDEFHLVDSRRRHHNMTLLGYPIRDDVLDVIDPRHAYRSGGEMAYFDPVRRLREAEREGVVAEFLHQGGPIGQAPFFPAGSRRVSDELRAAGARAHNRWLMDYCSEEPGRLLGVPCIHPWPDVEAAADDLAAARAAGMHAFYPPYFAGVPGDLPPFYDRWWDPLWA